MHSDSASCAGAGDFPFWEHLEHGPAVDVKGRVVLVSISVPSQVSLLRNGLWALTTLI